MYKTIKQLADELGVSKTAIRKYMTEEFRCEHTETNRNGVITIDSNGCKLIAETIKKPPETSENQLPQSPENPGLREEIAFLRAQLEAKDRQLSAKDAQIASLTAALENTTASLQAAQALHAGTMHQAALPERKGILHRWFGKSKEE